MTGEGDTGGDLTRLTVNLTPRSYAALHAAAEMTGDSPTDVVNRAIQAYAAMAEMGVHEGRYQLTVVVGGDPLYLTTCRTQPERGQAR